MAEMRKGKAPTVRRGPYKGYKLAVDHIIPRAVCPELDNVIANLKSMPLRMNESKNDRGRRGRWTWPGGSTRRGCSATRR